MAGEPTGGDRVGEDDRLRRLEEAVGFAERNAEQLGGQVVQLWQQVDALVARLGRMESRVGDLHRSIAERVVPGEEQGGGTMMDGPTQPTELSDEALRAQRPPHWDGGGGTGRSG